MRGVGMRRGERVIQERAQKSPVAQNRLNSSAVTPQYPAMMKPARRSAMPVRMPNGITISTARPTRISADAAPPGTNWRACPTASLKLMILSSALNGKNSTTNK
jgi:hypothetical protein